MKSQDRFEAKLVKGDPAECWPWLGARNSTRWYGRFAFGGRASQAHRVAYELYVGPIPPGLEIDHLCRNTICVNPNHLEAVTGSENRRRAQPGLQQRARCQRMTHCKRGHEFTPENTRALMHGRRCCRTCERAARAIREAQK